MPPLRRVLLVNQYFPPDRAATAQLLGQLAEDLSKKFDVRILCGTPTYSPDGIYKIEVPAIRIPLLPMGRSFFLIRLLNYFLFFVGAIFYTFSLPKFDYVMCWTDPPLTGLIGALVKSIQGCRFIFVSQDVYPEITRAARKLNNIVSSTLLGWTSSLILNRADSVVALSEEMKKKLIQKGCPLHKLSVISNWQDLEQLRPAPNSSYRQQHAISQASFVIMHSGNIGFSQDFETLLQTAGQLKDQKDVLFAIVGDGARSKELRRSVQKENLSNVLFLPYQDREHLSDSLSSADIHYVSLKPEFLGLIVPSKMYGILAAGRPILANVPTGCEVDRVVRESECGWIVSPDPLQIAALIRQLIVKRDILNQRGSKGREWIEKNASRTIVAEKYGRIFESVSDCRKT